jgi:crossover junction endodeoxyribonuclease RuvC
MAQRGRRIIGIDPGVHGGVAVIDRGENLVFCELLATTTAADFASWTTGLQVDVLVVIEKAQARPGQGVVSMFTFGQGYGRLIGWCEALGLPWLAVPPAQWSRQMHEGTAGDNTKHRSIQAARRLFPHVALTVGKSKKVHDGLAEALLIAEYGSRKFAG